MQVGTIYFDVYGFRVKVLETSEEDVKVHNIDEDETYWTCAPLLTNETWPTAKPEANCEL